MPQEYISVYTRAQAIDDGFLIDVSSVAKEAGITFPVALTSAVYGEYVEVPEGVKAQDVQGRLWDILWMLRVAIKKSDDGSLIMYDLMIRNDNRQPKKVTLKALCHGGDEGEPVITIMLPKED